jgi:hypothetical protein
MAYINHPTRYLIVKDPAAVAAGRFWAALVSLGKLRPAAHLVKLFFQLSFGAPVRFDRAADSATEGRFYARPSGPSTLFFNSVSLSRSGRVAVSRSRSRAIYPTARGPSTLFFQPCSEAPLRFGPCRLPEKRRCVSTSLASARQHFFQVRFACAIRSCPAFRARAGLSTQPPPERQHLFSYSCERLAAASPARPGFPQREGASTWAEPGRQAKDYPRPWYFPAHHPGRRSGSPVSPGPKRSG